MRPMALTLAMMVACGGDATQTTTQKDAKPEVTTSPVKAVAKAKAKAAVGQASAKPLPTDAKVGHCGLTERVVFTCVVTTGDWLSVCAPRGQKGQLQYRFGAPGKVALEYPDKLEGSADAFRFTSSTHMRQTNESLIFRQGMLKYTVYSQPGGEGGGAGVLIEQGRRASGSKACAPDTVVDRLDTLKGIVPGGPLR